MKIFQTLFAAASVGFVAASPQAVGASASDGGKLDLGSAIHLFSSAASETAGALNTSTTQGKASLNLPHLPFKASNSTKRSDHAGVHAGGGASASAGAGAGASLSGTGIIGEFAGFIHALASGFLGGHISIGGLSGGLFEEGFQALIDVGQVFFIGVSHFGGPAIKVLVGAFQSLLTSAGGAIKEFIPGFGGIVDLGFHAAAQAVGKIGVSLGA